MRPAEDTNPQLRYKLKALTSYCVNVVPQVLVYSVPISLHVDERFVSLEIYYLYGV